MKANGLMDDDGDELYYERKFNRRRRREELLEWNTSGAKPQDLQDDEDAPTTNSGLQRTDDSSE